MKTCFKPGRSILSVSISALVLGTAFAPRTEAVNTDLYWDADGATTAATGGTGTWNTSSALWRLTTATGSLQNYDNTSPSVITAHLGGTAGTLTIASGVTINVNSLVFDAGATGNYTLAGANSTTSILNFSGTAPTIVNNFGGIETISAKITGSSGFTLTGGNFTVITGDLTGLSGIVNVNGRLNLASTVTGSQLQAWSIGSGGTLTTNNQTSGSTLQLGSLSGVGTLRTGNTGSPALGGTDIFQIGALNTSTTFSGTIIDFTSGGGTSLSAITKVGTGTLTLTGTGNTYSGGTNINAGTLAVSQNNGLGTGGISFTGSSTLQAAGTSVSLNNAITLGTASVILDTNGNSFSLTGGISNSAATNNAIKAAGTGTLTLGGVLNLTGGVDTDNPALMLGNRNGANFNRGTVTITGTGSLSRISTGWDNTANTLNFASTGTVTMAADLVTGQSANGVGVVNQTTGTLNMQNLNLANWDGSYGAYTMSGGTLNTSFMRNGGNGNGNGNSYFLQTGGTVNSSTTNTLSRNGSGTNVLNIAGAGAQFNAGTGNFNLAFSADSTGIITVGAGLLTVNSNILLSNGGTSSTFGIVNLNGGIVRPNSIASANSAGNSIVNFNGGTLQANIDNTTFMAGLTSANIYSGGATIDTNSKSITIGQVLQGASGSGVSSIAVTGGGAGYLAAPVVKITGGGGTGATAIAVVSAGVVTGIQLTSAGTGYTGAPAVTLIGGGATTAATLGAIATAANAANGVLTKSGVGTLTLSGGNTYAGGTTISVGTLAVANNSALGTGALTIGTGTTLANLDSVAHTLANNIVFGSVSGMTATFSTSSDLTLNGALSGGTNGVQIIKQGTGTLTLPDIPQNEGTATAPAVWTITGGGTLSLTRGNNIGTLPTAATTQVILDNGTFKTNTAGGNFFSQRGMQINAAGGTWLDSGGGVNFDGAVADSGIFTINSPVSNATTLLNGAISGSGSLVKSGTGTLSLTATSTYTGATTINAGTLSLSGSLSNTAISVLSGASFSPVQTVSAGLGSGSAGASLALNSGAIFDMTSASAGTINTFTLNPGNSFSGQALNVAGANLRFDLGASSADRLQVSSGTASVSGTNNIRINTGGSLTSGTYTLLGSAAGGLTGTFQFDGGSTLSVPALSQIKQVGGTFYRLTLQNSGTAEQVVVSAAPSNVINVMPLGSSITEGVSAEGATYAGGGYRSQLYQSLVNDGRFTPHFVGSNTVLDNNAAAGYNVLTGANELHHEGHGGYTTTDVMNNLNSGALWLASGNGVNPDYVTLSIGGNDYGASASETVGPLNRTDAIVTSIQSLRPGTQIILANLFYRTQTVSGVVVGDLQNTYYNPRIPGVVFNHVLAGQHVSFEDSYTAVTPGNNVANISDGIHPFTSGYNLFATSWYNVIAFGSAYWTGAQDSQWSTVTGGNATNFAQNYQLTTPRQTALSASTDVYFNSNAAPLATTLGQNISVRSLNFAAGATGAVTVAGASTLTLGEGGITVQAGTGAHVISANVALGADQTWGNVSANALTVSGAVSGAKNLTFTGSYSIQVATGVGNATTTQTVSGTGAIVLSGANTYTGSTTVSNGTLQIGGGGTTGSLSTGSAITNNGALVFNRTDTVTQGTHFSAAAITGSGSLTQAGTGTLVLNAANSYTGATTVSSGVLATGSLQANGTASGIGQGTALTLNGGTLRYTGGANGNGFNRAITVGAGGGTLDNFGGGFVFYDGVLSGTGPLTFLDSSSTSHEWLLTGSSPAFSGNVFVGNGTAGSGLLQYRSSNASPFGTGIIQVNGGGIVSADIGTTNPSTLGNNFVLNGGLLGTQGSNMTYSGTISLTASSTLGNVPAYNTNGTLTFSNVISGGSAAALTIASASSVTLTGNNTFTGATIVSSGTLSAAAAGALGATGGIAVNTGSTLLLAGAGSANRVNDAAGLTLNGGTLSTAGMSSSSETMGSLTLSANSTIDFGTGSGDQLSFTGVGAHTAGSTLSILNWSGTASTVGGSGSDRLIFSGISSAFTNAFAQADVSFGGFGTGYSAVQFDASYFEIVAVPEPTTIFGGLVLLGLAGWRESRRRTPRARSVQ